MSQKSYKTKDLDFILDSCYTEEKFPGDYSHPSDRQILDKEKKLGRSFENLFARDEGLVNLLIRIAELNEQQDKHSFPPIEGTVSIRHFGATRAISYSITPFVSDEAIQLPRNNQTNNFSNYQIYGLYLTEINEKFNFKKGIVDRIFVENFDGKHDLKIDLFVKNRERINNKKESNNEYVVALYEPHSWIDHDRVYFDIVAVFERQDKSSLLTRGDGISLYELKKSKVIDEKAANLNVLLFSTFWSNASLKEIVEDYSAVIRGSHILKNKAEALSVKLPQETAAITAAKQLIDTLQGNGGINSLIGNFSVPTYKGLLDCNLSLTKSGAAWIYYTKK